jgi:hypothetical protein
MTDDTPISYEAAARGTQLAGIVGVDSADAALQICANFYPDEPVSPDPPPFSANYSADHSSFVHLPTPILPRAEPAARRVHSIINSDSVT